MYQKLLLLDTARKFFTVSQIKTYIDALSAAGFTHFQLYFSDNQGFRLALDDMVITTSEGISYDLRPCLGRGYAQPDKKMYPHETDEVLSEADMDELIRYARERGIEIIPCINSPGHMGAVLEHFPQFRYTDEHGTSKSSIDLRNEQAVAFAYAFVEKYVKYFKDRGIRYFNLGADEYANDVEGMGFEGLIRAGLYGEFVAFLNRAAQMVLDAGMTPRIFNDGAYYGGVEDFSLNPKIEVYYWERYDRVAPVSACISHGHKVINTNKCLYYVVAEDPWICVTEEVAKHFDKDVFADGTVVPDSIGTMMCIWCDDGRDGWKVGCSSPKDEEEPYLEAMQRRLASQAHGAKARLATSYETMTTDEIMRETLPVIRALKI